jgi:hypothetical protein
LGKNNRKDVTAIDVDKVYLTFGVGVAFGGWPLAFSIDK